MSPHLIIITSAMSLGGMASVGFHHYGDVQEQVASYSAERTEEKEQRGLDEFGEQVSGQLAELESSLAEKLERDKAGFLHQLATVVHSMEQMESKQESLEVLMSRMAQEQMEIEFVVETLGDSFVPLRAIESRFEPVNASARAHPLLPPVEGEWKERY